MKWFRAIFVLLLLSISIKSSAVVIGETYGIDIHREGNKTILIHQESKDTLNFASLPVDARRSIMNVIAKDVNGKGPDHPENIQKFKNARNFTFLVILAFLINIPFYIRWAKKQEGSEEVLLYNVEGKFTYLSIVMWIDRMEALYKKPLTKERKEIEKLYTIAQKANKPIKIFKRKIHDILLVKAFGKRMMRNAFQRMENYSKFTYSLDIAVYLSIIYSMICAVSIDFDWGLSIVLGALFGNIIAAPIWLITHLTFNHLLKSVARKEIKAGRGMGLRIIMAQFYGAFGGIVWKDLYYIQGKSSWTFAGAGSGRRGYGPRVQPPGYSTGYSPKESADDLDFDEEKK